MVHSFFYVKKIKEVRAVVCRKSILSAYLQPIPKGMDGNAQMAELVDALVSNTNEVTLVPVRLRLWVHKKKACRNAGLFYLLFFR